MIKAQQDFWAGFLFAGFGALIFWVGRNYTMGTAGRMGSGYFPMLLAGALCLVGIIIMARAFWLAGEKAPRFALRSFLPLVAVVAFGLLLEPAGLVIATAVLIALSVIGGEGDRRWRDAVLLSALLIPFNWLIFVWALGLPLPMWPNG